MPWTDRKTVLGRSQKPAGHLTIDRFLSGGGGAMEVGGVLPLSTLESLQDSLQGS